MNSPSLERFQRSFADRLRVNRQLLENAYWRLPVLDEGHREYVPVGRLNVTSPMCGRWMHFWVCDDVEAHKGKLVKGMDCTDKDVVTHQHMWCHRAGCPKCFIRGWSVREARAIAGVLNGMVEQGYGKIEHVSVSLPESDYDLPLKQQREKAVQACLARGVLGGTTIYHGHRKMRGEHGLRYRPHFHVLGFIRGGFDVCRECVHKRGQCAKCRYFKGREVREYKKDGILVKVHEARKTVIGTAFYQLNHATMRVGLHRSHIVTWFGICGNSKKKVKSKKLKAKAVCPACGGEMVKKAYVGKIPIAGHW